MRERHARGTHSAQTANTHTNTHQHNTHAQAMAIQLDDSNLFRFHWPLVSELVINRWAARSRVPL